jgi:hypothetical protein
LKKPVYVVGPYHTQCGGCDGVPTQQEAADRAVAYHEQGGHVILEGLLMSGAGPKGAVTATLEKTKDYCHCFLDTPLETCIERIKQRRIARGDERELNTKNTELKFYQVVSTYKSLKKDGYNVALLDHNEAYETVLHILKEADKK